MYLSVLPKLLEGRERGEAKGGSKGEGSIRKQPTCLPALAWRLLQATPPPKEKEKSKDKEKDKEKEKDKAKEKEKGKEKEKDKEKSKIKEQARSLAILRVMLSL